MEIITNLEYNKERHRLEPFIINHFKPAIFPMISHKVVGNIMDGRNMIQAMEQLMVLDWRTMLQIGTPSTSQKTIVTLADDRMVCIYLLQTHAKDKMVMMVVGNKKDIEHIVIAYVGNQAMFDDYLKELNVSQIECYNNLIHLEEENHG